MGVKKNRSLAMYWEPLSKLASEQSEQDTQQFCSIENCDIYTRKKVPITGERAHSLYFWSFKMRHREEGKGGGGGGGRGQNQNNRPINLPKVLTFFTDYTVKTRMLL